MGPTTEEDDPSLCSRKQSITSTTPPSRAGLGAPTTFFLRSEEEMNKDSNTEDNRSAAEASTKTIQDSSYGVQSLEDAIASSVLESPEAEKDNNGHHKTTVLGKRKSPKNPVHPKIIAAAQRIISPESPRAGSSSSLVSSPSQNSGGEGRRASQEVSISQPLTPFRLSPSPTPGDSSAQPSTPKTGSLRSLPLSDDDEDVAVDEMESQAVESSVGEDEGGDEMREKDGVAVEKAPQLVMPSIRMPTRRPFTERGKWMGNLKILVAGAVGEYIPSSAVCWNGCVPDSDDQVPANLL